MRLEAALSHSPMSAIPAGWRLPLLRLSLAWLGLIALLWQDWAEMFHQWWNASTYNHILLIPPILAWLLLQRVGQLARLEPRAWWPGLVWLAAAMGVWLIGTAADINLISQFGTVMALQAAVLVLLGPRVAVGVLFLLGYMFFLVPFGDELIPTLQSITADMAVGLTRASGVAAEIEGVFIDTPAGLFEVAEACSGVKFLVAMIALGALVAHLCFASLKRRALFMAACLIVPILANGVRAWGTIYVAQSQGLEFAAGFDHIVYGWIFFAVVMTGLLAAAWPFFDRSADDPLVDVEAIQCSPLLGRAEAFSMSGPAALMAIALMVGIAVTGGPAIARPLVASAQAWLLAAGPSWPWMDRSATLP